MFQKEKKAAKRNRRRRKSSVLYVVCPALRQFVVNREREATTKKENSLVREFIFPNQSKSQVLKKS